MISCFALDFPGKPSRGVKLGNELFLMDEIPLFFSEKLRIIAKKRRIHE
jgi:hypothetical protein